MPLARYRATIKIGDVDPPIAAGEIVLLDPEDPIYASYFTESESHGPLLVPADPEPELSPGAAAFAEALVSGEPMIAAEIPSEEEIAAAHMHEITTTIIEGESDHEDLDLVAVESGDVVAEGGDETGDEGDTSDGLSADAAVGDAAELSLELIGEGDDASSHVTE